MRLPFAIGIGGGIILAAAVIAQTPNPEAAERATVQKIYDRIAGAQGSGATGRTRSRFRIRRWLRHGPGPSR